MDIEGGILLTTQQINTAPADVQDWLRRSVLGLEVSEDGFVLEQNGVVSSANGLAICSLQEIKAILRALAANYPALQVFFQLGCNYRNPITGERHPRVLRLADFRRHTDIGSIPRLHTCIHDINQALQNLRGDPNTTLCQIAEHDVYHVDATTQYRIYLFWLRLAGLAAKHGFASPFPERPTSPD